MRTSFRFNKNVLKQNLANQRLREKTQPHNSGHESSQGDYAGLKAAAVTVIFLNGPRGVSLLFTKRSAGLGEHAGQISFPGGGAEPADPDIQAAALRETSEEIGIEPDELEMWGALPPQPVLDSWLIHPFAAWWESPRPLKTNPAEVDRVIIVSLAELFKQHRPECWIIPNPALSCVYQISGEALWGATARVTGRLLDRLLADEERTPPAGVSL